MKPVNVLIVNHTSLMSGAELTTLELLREQQDTFRYLWASPVGPLADAARTLGAEHIPLRGTAGSTQQRRHEARQRGERSQGELRQQARSVVFRKLPQAYPRTSPNVLRYVNTGRLFLPRRLRESSLK